MERPQADPSHPSRSPSKPRRSLLALTPTQDELAAYDAQQEAWIREEAEELKRKRSAWKNGGREEAKKRDEEMWTRLHESQERLRVKIRELNERIERSFCADFGHDQNGDTVDDQSDSGEESDVVLVKVVPVSDSSGDESDVVLVKVVPSSTTAADQVDSRGDSTAGTIIPASSASAVLHPSFQANADPASSAADQEHDGPTLPSKHARGNDADEQELVSGQVAQEDSAIEGNPMSRVRDVEAGEPQAHLATTAPQLFSTATGKSPVPSDSALRRARRWLDQEERKDSELDELAAANPTIGYLIEHGVPPPQLVQSRLPYETLQKKRNANDFSSDHRTSKHHRNTGPEYELRSVFGRQMVVPVTPVPALRDDLERARWPHEVVHLADHYNPLGIGFPFIHHDGKCGCKTSCRVRTCANGEQGRFCTPASCSFGGTCGNSLAMCMSLRLMRKKQDLDGGTTKIEYAVSTSQALAKDVAIGQYLGRLTFEPVAR